MITHVRTNQSEALSRRPCASECVADAPVRVVPPTLRGLGHGSLAVARGERTSDGSVGSVGHCVGAAALVGHARMSAGPTPWLCRASEFLLCRPRLRGAGSILESLGFEPERPYSLTVASTERQAEIQFGLRAYGQWAWVRNWSPALSRLHHSPFDVTSGGCSDPERRSV
jgi:hypothetical protein